MTSPAVATYPLSRDERGRLLCPLCDCWLVETYERRGGRRHWFRQCRQCEARFSDVAVTPNTVTIEK